MRTENAAGSSEWTETVTIVTPETGQFMKFFILHKFQVVATIIIISTVTDTIELLVYNYMCKHYNGFIFLF